MSSTADPNFHRQAQQRMVAHAQRLMENEDLQLDTISGLKPVTQFVRKLTLGDDAVAVKRKMIELGLFDRELQRSMPVGQTLEVVLLQKALFGGSTPVGRVRLVCLSPTGELLKGETPTPLDAADVSTALASQPPPLGTVPQTTIVVSTTGLTDDARRLIERRPGRTMVLVELNDAGGWTVTAPRGLEEWASLLDPESSDEKRLRIIAAVEESTDLLTGGVAADRLAERLHLPRDMVVHVLRDYAKSEPDLAIRSLEGTLVLYREGTGSSGLTGDNMPFWEKVKGIFGRGESREKKVARLAQERALLAHQRDKAYAEIELVERKESELTAGFPSATPLAQKRIATEISQLRKRVERVQQLVSTIDKKINIVETGMHNLEMEHQLSPEKLESLENVAQSSEHVDVGLATLDQLNEQADSVSVAASEISGGAQDVLEELKAKFAAKKEEVAAGAATGPEKGPAARERVAAAPAMPPPIPGERRRVPGAAEPG